MTHTVPVAGQSLPPSVLVDRKCHQQIAPSLVEPSHALLHLLVFSTQLLIVLFFVSLAAIDALFCPLCVLACPPTLSFYILATLFFTSLFFLSPPLC